MGQSGLDFDRPLDDLANSSGLFYLGGAPHVPVLPSPSHLLVLPLLFVQVNKPLHSTLTTRDSLGLADRGDGGATPQQSALKTCP